MSTMSRSQLSGPPSAQQLLQKQIRAAFKMFDYNNKDTIQTRDYGVLMRSLGYEVTEDTANSIAQKLDKKADGVIHYEQFKNHLLQSLNSEEMKRGLKEAYWAMDADGDGAITLGDLRVFMKAAGVERSEQDLNEMLLDADITGSQSISYDEFVRLMLMR